MRVQSLGHVVLKVQSIERSEAFYAQLLGIPVVSRTSHPVRMTFFSLGNHHDLAIIAVGENAPTPDPTATGLAHVAFKVGEADEQCHLAAGRERDAGAFEDGRRAGRSLTLAEAQALVE